MIKKYIDRHSIGWLTHFYMILIYIDGKSYGVETPTHHVHNKLFHSDGPIGASVK